MHLCYIDESGNTGNNLKDVHQPFLVLTALLVPPENIKEIENDVRVLGYKHFAAESRNTDFEFHGDDLYNNRGRYFKKLSLEKRLNIMTELVEVVVKHQCIKIGYICVEKAKYYASQHIQQTAFQLLVEKIEERLQAIPNSYGLLIADEQDEIEQKLIDDLDHFKQHGTTFGYKKVEVSRIIDSVHFVQSNNNFLMQLTDVICYIIRRGKEARKKLLDEFGLRPNKESFTEWVDKHGHRGHRYFFQTYNYLNSKKPWSFSKDFPK